MPFRWKLLVLLVVISLVPILTARTLGTRAVRRLGEDLVSGTRERLVQNTTQRVSNLVEGYSAVLNANRERIEMALDSLAAAAEQRLAAVPPPAPEILLTQDFPGRIDAAPSPRHVRQRPGGRREMLAVSFVSPVTHLAPGVTASEVGEDMARLSGLVPVYRWMEERLNDDAIWFLTALHSGVASVYPGTGGIPPGVDPRGQEWYRHAVSGRPTAWSDPYVDPATRQMVVAANRAVRDPNGTITGAVAVVIPIERLLEHEFLSGRIPKGTRLFLCYLDTDPKNGQPAVRVYATRENTVIARRNWRARVEDMWLASADRGQFEAMVADLTAGSSGTRRMPFEGCDCLWVYGRLHHFTTFLVFITPSETIMQPAEKAEATIQKRVDGLIRMTGYGAGAVLVLVFFLAMAFSRTVTKPLNTLSQAALRLSEGDFDTRVDIRSRDEIGEMGRVFNMVGPRLREHADMRQSLALAREVQMTLLPRAAPEIAGFDIAGKSFNCDETGGDYFDYLPGRGAGGCAMGVLVGDVSGHGISAALLMTTARALIRQRAVMDGDLREVVSDVNRHLTADVGASGRFMTLFYALFDPEEKSIAWVRAGHDPAIFYDPSAALYEELGGKGLPLGVTEDAEFEVFTRHMPSGSIVLIGTDGIWEARNPLGKMLGKQAVYDVIGREAHRSAEEILKAVIEAVEQFRGGVHQEDDITLVVIKAVSGASRDSRC